MNQVSKPRIKTSLDDYVKVFLTTRRFNNFKDVTDESYKRIQIVEKQLNDSIEIDKENDKVGYAFLLITKLKRDYQELSDDEKILLFIEVLDPDYLTYKYYLSMNIPDISQYRKDYLSTKDPFTKKQAKLFYEEKVRQKNNLISEFRTKVTEKIGVFVPSLIKYEKILFLMNMKQDLLMSVKKDSLNQLANFLINREHILPLDDKEMDRLNVEIENYKMKFPQVDVNLLVYHVLNQGKIIGLKNISEQAFFLINAINSYYPVDENLSHIVDYNGNWNDMNRELKQLYGIKSEPLLRLQNYYNKVYNIKGDF